MLIAEDSIPLQASLLDVLSSMPNIGQIDQTLDVGQTLTAIRAHRPDLVLLDLRMPGGDSFSVLKALQASSPDPVVIVFSAEDDDAVRERCFELGAHGFFSKHSGAEDLRLTLQQLNPRDLVALRGRKESLDWIIERKSRRRGTRPSILKRARTAGSDDKLADLINSVAGIVWAADAATLQFTFVSKQAESILGYPVERWFGQDFWKDTIHPEDRAHTVRACLDATRRGEPHDLEYRMVAADGHAIWFRDIVSLVTEGEEIVGLRGIMVDITKAKEAETALRRSEVLFRELANAMPQMVWAARPDGTIDYVNQRVANYSGLPAGSVASKAWKAMIHPQDLADTMSVWGAAIRTGKPYEAHLRMRGLDENYRWYLARAQPAHDEAGEIVRWFGTCTDLDDELRIKNELTQAQRVARLGSWSLDLRTGQRFWSDELYRLFGLPAAENPPSLDSMLKILHPDDRESYLAERTSILATGVPHDRSYRIIRPGGDERIVQLHAAVEKDENGQILRIHGAAQDVTEAKLAQQHLQEQADLLDLSRDAIVVRDLDNHVRFWNCGAERIYGWTAAEVMGRSVLDFAFAETSEFLAAKRTLLETGHWTGHLRQIRKDGATITVDSRWTMVRDDQGQPKSVLVVSTDITERQKLEGKLQRSQRLESIGTLASGVAHDLNNILVPILMVAPLLRGEIDQAEREKFLDIVQSSAERGASIVKQVLTFARGADGSRILLQPIYLLQEIARIAENTFPKSITVRTRYHEAVRTLEADPAQLHQILLNLAVNARDAMPEGGVLTLALDNFDVDQSYADSIPQASTGPHVILQVTDTGIGISRDLFDKIFDPFFTTKEIGVGTGLGLSTIAGIVRGYGGFVNVYSEPGFTSFKVFLPTASASEARPEPRPFLRDRGCTILVVEDDPGVRSVTRAILVRQGYSTLVAASGTEGASLFARHSEEIAAVITDISMPGMDGLTLVRTLRQMRPTIRIILATGHDEDCTSEAVRTLGVEACLPKPFTRQTLLTTLERVLPADLAE